MHPFKIRGIVTSSTLIVLTIGFVRFGTPITIFVPRPSCSVPYMYIFFTVVVAVEIQNESVILQSLMGSELNRIFISFIYHYHYFIFLFFSSKAGMS